MAVTPGRITLDTNAQKLTSNQTDRGGATQSILLVPQASGTIVLGGTSGLTAANGCRVPVTAGQGISIDLDYGEAVYGLVASGTLAVDKLEQGI
jgi:hypothetical protein